jgi:anti-sigma factor RsiW
MMDHSQVLELLPAYLDRELSASEALALERHLADCTSCRAERDRQQAVIDLIRASDLRRQAPDDLMREIRAALPMPAQPRPEPRRPRPAFGLRPGRGIAAWLPAGATAFGMLALASAATLYLTLPSPAQRLAGELVDSHVRSLQMDHAIDVVSSDRHTVKPWFNGKIDFAPPVIDLAAQGYPLVGGRLDYLNGRTVAVLVYRYRLHPVDLYVWPADAAGGMAPDDSGLKGYRLAHWRAAGMNWWAITDAGQVELDGFVAAWRAQAGS